MDRTELESVVRHVLDEHHKKLLGYLLKVASDVNKNGMFRSSRHAVLIRTRVVEVANEFASKAAESIALACGSEAPAYVDIYERVCSEAERLFNDLYQVRTKNLGLRNAALIAGDQNIESEIAAAVAQHARELRLGIARERALMAIGNITINANHNQNSAFVFGDRNTLNQSAGLDAAAVVAAIQAFRGSVSAAIDLPADVKTKLDDEALTIEDEARKATPDIARLRRLATGLASRVDALAIGTAGSLLATPIQELLKILFGS